MLELDQFQPHMDNYADSQGWEHPEASARGSLKWSLGKVIEKYHPTIKDPAILLGLAIIESELSTLGNDIEDATYQPNPDIPKVISETAEWISTEFADEGVVDDEYLTTLSALARELPVMRHYPAKTS
jgi:hypothetical protein